MEVVWRKGAEFWERVVSGAEGISRAWEVAGLERAHIHIHTKRQRYTHT